MKRERRQPTRREMREITSPRPVVRRIRPDEGNKHEPKVEAPPSATDTTTGAVTTGRTKRRQGPPLYTGTATAGGPASEENYRRKAR